MKEKMEKKSSRHGEMALKQKCQNEPNNQTDEGKNKERNAKVMSQGTNGEKMMKINTQALTFFIFSMKFVVVVVKKNF